MEVSAATQAASAPTKIAEGKLAENFDNFLKLLTTQLQYQDPLSPIEANDFVSQLVQFSQVEQSINTNKNLEKLLGLQQGNLTSVGIDYIGKTVEADSDLGNLANGKAEFSYDLKQNAASTAIAIVDEKGHAVATFQGDTGAGRHDFVWDGKDGDGNTLPDGAYRFVVAALDKDGGQIGTAITATSKVTGVENGENGLLLVFDKIKVPFEKIKSVRETPPPAA